MILSESGLQALCVCVSVSVCACVCVRVRVHVCVCACVFVYNHYIIVPFFMNKNDDHLTCERGCCMDFSLIALGAEFGEMQSGIQPSSVGGAAEDELSEKVSRFVDEVIKNALISYEMELGEQEKGRVSISPAS